MTSALSSRSGDATLEIDDLLRIDVEAELRKVTRGQLLGPWQAPAELVRRAIRAGATKVDLRFTGRRLEILDDGAPISATVLSHLAQLLDRRNASRRHAGLNGLEANDEAALLCLAGLHITRLAIATSDGSTRTSLIYDGRKVTLERAAWREGQGTHFRLVARECASRRARNWLEQSCAFSPAAVRIDGRRIASPFADALFAAPIDDPLPGNIAFTREGDIARAWLLVHGVVVTHVHITPSPPFDAAIELSGLAGSNTSAADLRALLEPRLRKLVGRALVYLTGLARRASKLQAALLSRTTEILLHTAANHGGLASIEDLPLFPIISSDGEIAWHDLDRLRSLARDSGGRLFAADPHAAPRGFDAPCLLVSERARQLLAELLHVRLEQPRPKNYRGGRIARLRLWIASTASHAWLGFRRAVGRAPHALPSQALTASERNLLAALVQQRADATRLQIALCEGDGPIRSDKTRLWLPRANAEVKRAVTLFARDPAWLYPISMGLLGEHCSLMPTDRQHWWQLATPSTQLTPNRRS